MNRFTRRSAGWLRVSVVGAAATVLALAAGVAFGSESGNAPQFSTNAPDPVSAQVVVNGNDTPTGNSTAQLLVCFNKQVQTIGGGFTSGGPTSSSDNFVTHLQLQGYGANGEANGDQITLAPGDNLTSGGGPHGGFSDTSGYPYIASAASNPSNPNCVNVSITPQSNKSGGANAPGFDLNAISQVSVAENAGTGNNSLPTTPGTVALQAAGPSEVTGISGGSSGPKLIAASTNGLAPNQVGYVFSYNLDPNQVTAANFDYIDSAGTAHPGSSASVSGNTVVVTFGGTIVNDKYYEVFPGAVDSQNLDQPNQTTATGASVASVPTLRSVSKVPGVSGAYDLTYDQCVTDTDTGTTIGAVLEDNVVISPGANSVSRPSTDCRMIRVSFGSVANFSDYASKVVRLVDFGGEVEQQSGGSNDSAAGEADLSTPPNEQPGFVNVPNLIGFSVDTANGTATYVFDSQGGPLDRNSLSDGGVGQFGLLYSDGTNSFDAGSFGSGETFTGPNQITIQFNPSQVKNVVGGLLGTGLEPSGFSTDCKTGGGYSPTSLCNSDDAASDYEYTNAESGVISPQASGIGIGGIGGGSSSTTSTNSTVTTTSRTTTTTTTTKTTRCPRGKHRSHGRCVKNKKKKHKKCPKGKHRKGKKCVKNRKKK